MRNTRSKGRGSISGSNHPFMSTLLENNNIKSTESVNVEYPNKTSLHCGKFAEVHISEKPSYFRSLVVSPLSNLRTPIRNSKTQVPVTLSENKVYGNTQVRTPLSLHFLARSPNCAVKVQRIQDPDDIHDRAYHEVLIHKYLAKTAGKCPGFTMCYKWFKSYEHVVPPKHPRTKRFQKKIEEQQSLQRKLFSDITNPRNAKISKPLKSVNQNLNYSFDEDLLDDETEGEIESSEAFGISNSQNPEKEYFMNFVLEKADQSLDHYLKTKRNTVDIYTFKIILFQLLFSLQIMQRECGFVHHDLHKKNILIKILDPSTILKFSLLNGETWISKNLLIKIADFGHSRVSFDSGEVIYNRSNPSTYTFDASKDILYIRQNFKSTTVLYNSETMKKDKVLKRSLMLSFGKVKTTEDVRNLLFHPFFDSLKEAASSSNLFQTTNIRNMKQSVKKNIVCFEESTKWKKRKSKKLSSLKIGNSVLEDIRESGRRRKNQVLLNWENIDNIKNTKNSIGLEDDCDSISGIETFLSPRNMKKVGEKRKYSDMEDISGFYEFGGSKKKRKV